MSKYFYTDGKEKKGPYSFEDLKNQEINPETLIWFEGLENWTPAKQIEKLEEILRLVPPPIKIKVNVNNSENNEPSKNADLKNTKIEHKKTSDKSLSKNLPFLILASIITGVIGQFSLLTQANFGEIIGIMLATLLFLTGLPLLIVRIVKWLSKNKRWNKKATQTTWIIQLIITFLYLYGTFVS